jgi:hypothetical protein
MRVSKTVLIAATVAVLAACSANRQQTAPAPCCTDQWNPGWMHREQWQPRHIGSVQRQRVMRHRSFMNEGAPSAYRGARSTVATTEGTISAGKRALRGKLCFLSGVDGYG